MKIKGDTGDSVSNETLTINQVVTIKAVNGAVRIGVPEGRGEVEGRASLENGLNLASQNPLC